MRNNSRKLSPDVVGAIRAMVYLALQRVRHIDGLEAFTDGLERGARAAYLHSAKILARRTTRNL